MGFVQKYQWFVWCASAGLASGFVWLATSNELGGILRTPATFNGIIGLRPIPRRAPKGTRLPALDTLWVEGPMTRNVDDLALMLDAGVGQQIDDPLSFDTVGPSFGAALQGTDTPKRDAFSLDSCVVSVEKKIAHVYGNATSFFRPRGGCDRGYP